MCTQGIKVLHVATNDDILFSSVVSPIASRAQLTSAASLTTSYSTSFHPFKLFSIKTWGLRLRLLADRFLNSSSLWANPDPRPPSEKADRKMIGYPIALAASRAPWMVETAVDWAAGISISRYQHLSGAGSFANSPLRACTKRSRSSETSKVRMGVPNTLTPNRSSTPIFSSWIPTFNALCPPKVNRIPSGRSFSKT